MIERTAGVNHKLHVELKILHCPSAGHGKENRSKKPTCCSLFNLSPVSMWGPSGRCFLAELPVVVAGTHRHFPRLRLVPRTTRVLIVTVGRGMGGRGRGRGGDLGTVQMTCDRSLLRC